MLRSHFTLVHHAITYQPDGGHDFYSFLPVEFMKTSISTVAFLLFLATALTYPSHPAVANEFSGVVETQVRAFLNEPLYQDQHHHNASLAVAPEYYHQLENGSSITIAPFLRADSADGERSHFDVREMNFLWLTHAFELKIGISKVFWGATEFVHLVDIVNQTDLVEAIDYEEKLGQPMIQLSLPMDWGVVDMFVLPWFRERTFAGQKGRLRPELEVDVDNARYESSAEDHHVDMALRYSHTVGNMDFGLCHFAGTGREPTLVPFNDAAGSELLAGIVYDYEDSGRALTIEAARRFGSGFKVTLEAYLFSHLSQEDFIYDFRDDDYISVALAYYF